MLNPLVVLFDSELELTPPPEAIAAEAVAMLVDVFV